MINRYKREPAPMHRVTSRVTPLSLKTLALTTPLTPTLHDTLTPKPPRTRNCVSVINSRKSPLNLDSLCLNTDLPANLNQLADHNSMECQHRDSSTEGPLVRTTVALIHCKQPEVRLKWLNRMLENLNLQNLHRTKKTKTTWTIVTYLKENRPLGWWRGNNGSVI